MERAKKREPEKHFRYALVPDCAVFHRHQVIEFVNGLTIEHLVKTLKTVF